MEQGGAGEGWRCCAAVLPFPALDVGLVVEDW